MRKKRIMLLAALLAAASLMTLRSGAAAELDAGDGVRLPVVM